MSLFSFDGTAGESKVTQKLLGNDIYKVKFDGAEIKDYKEGTVKVLLLKFSNDEGYFTHTVFEPTVEKGDFKRGESKFMNKNGVEEKIPQPSNAETMMQLFKHLIDAVNPELGIQINKGEKSIGAPNWDGLRKLIVKATEKGIGVETNIKLLKKTKSDGKEEAVFPGFFAGIDREDPKKIYIKNKFIGNKLSFTAYETTKMNAAPKPMTNVSKTTQGSEFSMGDINTNLLDDPDLTNFDL